MPTPRSTGLSGFDAQNDFMRQRRRAALARLAARFRREPDDIGVVLPYDEVIEALGFVSERSLGLQVVQVDSIVGSVGRSRDFDGRFRPTSGRLRSRWEQIATAVRRGEPLPPVDLLQIGETHFVRDGHHRVSVARALGLGDLDAYVTEVDTRVRAGKTITHADLPPVVAMLREADLIANRTAADAYMRLTAERYRLLRATRWDEQVLEQLLSRQRGRGARIP